MFTTFLKNAVLKPLSAVALLALSAQAFATGLMSCEGADEADWRPMEALQTELETAGWEVRKVKVDDGCYEAYATTPEGDRVEAYFHPVTFEKLLVAARGGKILFKKESE